MKRLAALALLGVVAAIAASCSLQNKEGPTVTCADLQCGRLNACTDGIIAQCVDGKTMKYHVCESTGDEDDVCTADWQLAGQFRCEESQTDCEGCRPLQAGCP